MATVLIISHNTVDETVIRLLKEKGHSVVVHNNIDSGISKAVEVLPESILLYLTPNDSGLKLMAKLKDNFYTESIPIVAVSDVTDKKQRELMFLAGALDVTCANEPPEYVVSSVTPAIELGTLQRLVSRVMNRL
jgi:PleD family two-component response regulator